MPSNPWGTMHDSFKQVDERSYSRPRNHKSKSEGGGVGPERTHDAGKLPEESAQSSSALASGSPGFGNHVSRWVSYGILGLIFAMPFLVYCLLRLYGYRG